MDNDELSIDFHGFHSSKVSPGPVQKLSGTCRKPWCSRPSLRSKFTTVRSAFPRPVDLEKTKLVRLSHRLSDNICIYIYMYICIKMYIKHIYIYIYISNQKDRNMFPDVSLCRAPNSNWLVVSTPLKKMSSSVGMMTFPIYGKIIQMFQSTNQKVLS